MGEGGVDPFEIFNNIFGGGGRPRQRKTQDVMHKLSVSLEELYCGSTKKMALNRHIADSQGRVTKKKEVDLTVEMCCMVDRPLLVGT
eukprot:454839-Hanusia_phi.AAC.7